MTISKANKTDKNLLEDFNELSELIHFLQSCQEDEKDYLFELKISHKGMINHLLKKINADTHLVLFPECLEILKLMHTMDFAHGRLYSIFEKDLNKFLHGYQTRVHHLLSLSEETPEKYIPFIERFFKTFQNNADINLIRQKNETFIDKSSPAHKSKELILSLDKIAERFNTQFELTKRHISQAAYYELLQKYLNKEKINTIPLSKKTNKYRHTQWQSSFSLLPDTEFDVPTAEPEHPSRVGINQTMSFKPAIEKQSVLDGFKTNSLQQDFLHAFSWAISMQAYQQLRRIQHLQKDNLLGTDKLLPSEIQFAVIKYILLSLDTLGKITGLEGELSLSNFSIIYDITNDLEKIAAKLDDIKEENHQLILESINQLTNELSESNRLYYEIQQQVKPVISVRDNPEMNAFCHLNEHLLYQLNGVQYHKSILTPDVPSPSYSEKIRQLDAMQTIQNQHRK